MHGCIARPGGETINGKLWILASNITILPLVSPMFVLSLDEDVAELKELREVFEPERVIICQRSGQGKGCTMTWAPGDRVTVNIPYAGSVPGVVREVKMEGLSQKVRVTTVVHAPLPGRNIISEDKRWFDG